MARMEIGKLQKKKDGNGLPLENIDPTFSSSVGYDLQKSFKNLLRKIYFTYS